METIPEDIRNKLGINEREATALQEALADREAAKVNESLAQLEGAAPLELGAHTTELAQKVSKSAFDLIVQHETGGRKYYETVYGAHAVWPGAGSGVTIGFGYDLGYVSANEFQTNWSLLGKTVLDRFINEGAIGATGGKFSPDHMKAMCRDLRDIVITWETSETVFRAATLPKFASLTDKYLPNCDNLNGDCFGALVSLTFNRGASYGLAGDRYAEMRAIRKAMQDRTFAKIPGLIRAMTRIWAGSSIATEMRRRREDEAKLFENGLAALAVAHAPAENREAPFLETAELSRDVRDIDFFADLTEEEAAAAALESYGSGEDIQSAAEAAAIVWPEDAMAPDYAHLPAAPQIGLAFTLRAEDLELLAQLNAFPVEEAGTTPILFALRGCLISAGGSGEDGAWRDEATLKDVRPNHSDTRCTMGVWDRANKKIAAFPGSTVPNTTAIASWYRNHQSGNMLQPGLYRYSVGIHRDYPGCFILADAERNGRSVVVRRSSNNLYYDLADIYNKCAPFDDIHPTFGSNEHYFSSFGCQTIMGKVDSAGHHTGPWAKFRALAGLKTPSGTVGAQYLYLLLTGREAYLAADLRRKNLAADNMSLLTLRRLRFGSKGTEVAALQQKLLGVQPDGDFGPETSRLVHEQQRKANANASDGIYSPEMDSKLGWGVFSSPLIS